MQCNLRYNNCTIYVTKWICLFFDLVGVVVRVTESMLFLYSPASRVDCGTPTLAKGVTVEAYTSTAVNSDIFFQCLQPSNRSATCGSGGRWSPDPSQVECRMPMPPDTTLATGV